MTHEADVGAGHSKETVAVGSGDVTTIPGGAEKRRELASLTAEQVEDGGELFCEQQEAVVLLAGGQWLAKCLQDVARGRAGGDNAVGVPAGIGFGEEASDLTPAGSFAGFTGFSDQDDEQIETVTGGADEGVGGRSDKVSEGGEQLKENGDGIGFGMGREAADDVAGQTVESWFGQCGQGGIGGGLFFVFERVAFQKVL
jgi:hypothetical protein